MDLRIEITTCESCKWFLEVFLSLTSFERSLTSAKWKAVKYFWQNNALSLLHRHSWWSFFLHAWHDVVRRRGRQNNCFAIFGENFSLSLAERKFHGIFLYFLLKMHRSIEIDIHWIRRNSFFLPIFFICSPRNYFIRILRDCFKTKKFAKNQRGESMQRCHRLPTIIVESIFLFL